MLPCKQIHVLSTVIDKIKINASLEINRRAPKGLHSRSARLLGTIRV